LGRGRNGKGKASIRLQKAIPMAIDNLNRIAIGDRNMIRLNPNNLAVFLVSGINGKVAPPATGLVHEPEVGERGGERGGDISEGICTEVGEEVVEDWGEEEDPRRKQVGGEHVCGGGAGRRSVDGWEYEDGERVDFSVCHCEEVIESCPSL
jgi:hypothetical protein